MAVALEDRAVAVIDRADADRIDDSAKKGSDPFLGQHIRDALHAPEL